MNSTQPPATLRLIFSHYRRSCLISASSYLGNTIGHTLRAIPRCSSLPSIKVNLKRTSRASHFLSISIHDYHFSCYKSSNARCGCTPSVIKTTPHVVAGPTKPCVSPCARSHQSAYSTPDLSPQAQGSPAEKDLRVV